MLLDLVMLPPISFFLSHQANQLFNHLFLTKCHVIGHFPVEAANRFLRRSSLRLCGSWVVRCILSVLSSLMVWPYLISALVRSMCSRSCELFILIILLFSISWQCIHFNYRLRLLEVAISAIVHPIVPLCCQIRNLHHQPFLLSVRQDCLATLVDSLTNFESNMIPLYDLCNLVLHLPYHTKRK